MVNPMRRIMNWLMLSALFTSLMAGKAMNQSRADTPVAGNLVRSAPQPIGLASDVANQWLKRIRMATPEEAVRLFAHLFWLSPELAQTIPCLPPLGDWSGNRISSGFGWRNHPTLHTVRHHDGIDIAGPQQFVRAAATGRVAVVGLSKTLGHYVRVDHVNSFATVYGHLAMVLVRPGQSIRIGETMGITGRSGQATGVHLHYSVLKRGIPVDPTSYLTLAIQFVHAYQQPSRRTAGHPATLTERPTWQK